MSKLGSFFLILFVIVSIAIICPNELWAQNMGATFNIIDAGADYTGMNDSSTAIESAIENACLNAQRTGHAKVFVPPGIYLINAASGNTVHGHLSFTVDGTPTGIGCNNIEFVGLPGARGATIIRANASNLGAIIYDSAPHTNLAIDNITFDGNGSALQNPLQGGVGLIDFIGPSGPLTNLSIKNCVFENVLSGTEAVKIDEGSDTTSQGSLSFTDNQFMNNITNYGYSVNTGYGQEIFVLDRMANFQISRNYFTGNTSYSGMIGLYAYDSYGEIDHNMFLGNTATTGDMYIQQSSHVIFDHNFDELPDNGTVALRIVNSTDLIIDGEDIIGKSNSSAPGGTAIGTISLSGTWTASDTLTATIQPPFPIASPLVASIITTGTPESLPSAAASLANAINTSGAQAFLTATASGNNITLTSNFVGPTGNITGYFASSAYPTPTGSPAGIIVSPTAQATFTGGSEPPSYGMTIYDNASRHAVGQLVITGMNPSPAPQTINVVFSLPSESPFTASYPVQAGDTVASVTTNLASAIATSCRTLGSSCYLETPSPLPSTGTIVLYAASDSSTGNSIVAVPNQTPTPSPAPSVTPNPTASPLTGFIVASSAFAGGGTFDGISTDLILYSRDITVANSTFDTLYRGLQIPGKYGNPATGNPLYGETQKAITLSDDIVVRNGDAFVYLPLFDLMSTPSQIRLVGDVIKEGTYTTGLLFVDWHTGGGPATDLLVQSSSCGASSYASPSPGPSPTATPSPFPAPVCVRVNDSTVKLIGNDFSNLASPIAVMTPGAVSTAGNL